MTKTKLKNQKLGSATAAEIEEAEFRKELAEVEEYEMQMLRDSERGDD